MLYFQVIKPVNLEALSKWVGQIPDDVVQVLKHYSSQVSLAPSYFVFL